MSYFRLLLLVLLTTAYLLAGCSENPTGVEPPDEETTHPLDWLPLYDAGCTPQPVNNVEGRIVFQARAEDENTRLYTVNPDGSDLRVVTSGNYNSTKARWSRDGTMLAFQSDSIDTTIGPMMYVMDASGSIQPAVPDYYGSGFHMAGVVRDWSPDNRFLLALACELCDPFPVSFQFLLDLTGAVPPFQLTATPEVPFNVSGSTLSPDGSMIAFSWADTTSRRLLVADADGTNLRRFETTEAGNWPAWSPDGCRIAFGRIPEGERLVEIYYYDLTTGEVNRVTEHSDERHFDFPRWSPDGTRLVFSSRFTGRVPSDRNLYIHTVNLDGTDLRRVVDIPTADFPDWSWEDPVF